MRDDERRRVEELWTRYVARESLTPEERAWLTASLEADEVFRRRLMHDLQVDGALRAAGEIEHGQESVIREVKALVIAAGRTEEVVAAVRKQLESKAAARARVPTPAPLLRTPAGAGKPWRVSRVLAATTLLAAAAALLLLVRPRLESGKAPPPSAQLDGPGAAGRMAADKPARPPARGRTGPAPVMPVREPIARLEALEGPAYRHGIDGTVRASPVLEIAAGDWVSTSGPTARARLAGPDGSRVDLTGDAVAGLTTDGAGHDGARLFLAHGRATAAVSAGRNGSTLILASPHAVVTGVGRLQFDVAPTLTRVEVQAGRVRVSALGVQRGTDVDAGQMAFVRADDLLPPRAQVASREALLLTGPDDTKEEPPTVPDGLRGSEERLKARLERLGFQVTVASAGALPPERAQTAALLVFSSSVSSKQLAPWVAQLAVPMLVLESTGFEHLGLSGTRWRRDLGPTVPLSEIVIENPAHPLSAGLSGTVRVLAAPANLRWVAPSPSGVVIASYAGAPEQAALMFGYERGAQTAAGMIAPARRVGLFLGNGRVIRALTDNGWRLFDAAVLWCTGG